MRRLPLVSGLAVLLAAASLTAPATASSAKCHANKYFAVAEKEYDEGAGAQFAVRALTDPKTAKNCRFTPSKKDFVIGRPGDPLWFGALDGKWLILTRSTGPQGDLVVYDLASRKAVLDVPSDSYEVKKGELSFWQRTGEATAATCPEFAEHQANGLGSAITQLKVLDLHSGKLTDKGQQRCEATQ